MREEKYLVKEYIKENPASFVGIHFLSQLYATMEPKEILETYAFIEPFKKLNDDIWKAATTLNIESKVKALRATAIGQKAIPISKNELYGNILYKLGDKEQELVYMQRSMDTYKSMGSDAMGITERLRAQLEKMQKGEKTWK